MSQKVRIDGVKHVGASVFLGVDHCGNPRWTRNPERIMAWLCDGWRARFNQRREQRPHNVPVKDEAGGIVDWVKEPLGGPNVAELLSDREVRLQCSWMAGIPAPILSSTDRIEGTEWSAGLKRKKTAGGRVPGFKSRHRNLGFVCWRNASKTGNAIFHKTGRKSGVVVITGMNPTRWRKPGEKLHWRVVIHVRVSQPIRPYTSVHVDWTHRTLVFVNMPLPLPRTGNGKVGIDRGCVHTLALSDGTFMDMPKPSKAELKRLKYLQRKMARQDRVNEARGGRTAKFASKRRQKTLDQFNVLQGHIVRRRNDWIEKTTTRLACENVLIAMEDLDVKAMTKRPKPKPDPNKPGQYLHNGAKAKAGLDRSILSNNWSRLMTRLKDKMDANGGRLAIVPAAYTSRTCHQCGHVAKGNRESQAVFRCVECGYMANADVNAAMNILDRALAKTGGGTAWDVEGRVGGPMKRQPLSHRPEVPLGSGLRRESPGFSRGEDVKESPRILPIRPFSSASSPASRFRNAPVRRSSAPSTGFRPERRRMVGIAVIGPPWPFIGRGGASPARKRRSAVALPHSPGSPPTHKALVTLEKTSRWNRRKGQGTTCPQRICLQAMRR